MTRIADFDRQIANPDRAITTTVKDYAKAGLPASAIAEVTASHIEERRQIADIREEAAAWLEETEAAEQRARDLEALADMARTRLHDMTPAEQGEVLALLDVRVTITGPVPKPKLGLSCSLAEWFKENKRLVPAELTDDLWALVEPMVSAWEPEHPNSRLVPGRQMLDAMFYKARTGVRWSDLPERFGLWEGIHNRYKRWRTIGMWDRVMEALPDEGTVIPELNLVPPFRVEGRVDPRVLTDTEPDMGAQAASTETGVPGPMAHRLSTVSWSARGSLCGLRTAWRPVMRPPSTRTAITVSTPSAARRTSAGWPLTRAGVGAIRASIPPSTAATRPRP